jgi:MFS family permease
MKGPLRHPPLRWMLGARLFSVLAVQMTSVAVAWQVYERTWDPLALGMVGLAQFLPLMLLSPIAGEIADRVDRRHVLVGCHVLGAIAAASLAVISELPSLGAAPVYAALVLMGAARAFRGPAGQALVPALVPKAELAQAIALASTIWQIATIAGPALGGAIVGALGTTAVYVLAGSLEVVTIMFFLRMRYQPEPLDSAAAGGWKRLLAGVRYVLDNRVILAAISIDLFAVLLGGAVALMPIYARDILHVEAWGLGLLRSAPAIGAGGIALLLAFRPLRRRAGLAMLGCVVVFGVATIVFGLSTSFPLSLVALVVLGAADMVSVVVRHTVVQIATPPEMRGRVAAVNMMFISASNELGEVESGVTAAWLGTVPAVVVGGIGAVLVAATWAVVFPELRRLDRLDVAPTSVPRRS